MVFGSKGNPKSVRHPDQHTIVPWEEVKAEQEAKEKDEQQEKAHASDTPKMPTGGWKLLEDNDLIRAYLFAFLTPNVTHLALQ
jgi:hypothetical protein